MERSALWLFAIPHVKNNVLPSTTANPAEQPPLILLLSPHKSPNSANPKPGTRPAFSLESAAEENIFMPIKASEHRQTVPTVRLRRGFELPGFDSGSGALPGTMTEKKRRGA
jgi:hypothetical protein